MSDVSVILSEIESGNLRAAESLLPCVYEQLRRLAAADLAREKPGQTLQATALVHAAYLRLVDQEQPQKWKSRGHFFAAAAEAMRRILVETARRKAAEKYGGGFQRREFKELQLDDSERPDEVLAVHESLDELARQDSVSAELVKLHYFGGFSLDEAADLVGVSRATAYRRWLYAKAWLRAFVEKNSA